MAHMSRRFNFDDFDELCAEALGDRRELDHQMAQEGIDYDEEQTWAEHDRVFLGKRPGEIGGVACRPSLLPDQPAQPDNVVDLNANVIELRPPNDVA